MNRVCAQLATVPSQPRHAGVQPSREDADRASRKTIAATDYRADRLRPGRGAVRDMRLMCPHAALEAAQREAVTPSDGSAREHADRYQAGMRLPQTRPAKSAIARAACGVAAIALAALTVAALVVAPAQVQLGSVGGDRKTESKGSPATAWREPALQRARDTNARSLGESTEVGLARSAQGLDPRR